MKPSQHFLLPFLLRKIGIAVACLLGFNTIFMQLATAQITTRQGAKLTAVDSGWAGNSVNAVVFRKNSLVSVGDTQFISFYNQGGHVVVGKRKMGTEIWQLKETPFKGNVKDAHNTISLMTDGDGFLHLAWDHHNNQLHYSRSIAPGSLDFAAPSAMTGNREASVSYPEFYKLPGGNILFFYRDGGSGRGNLVIDLYDYKTRQWKQLHSNLVDGEGRRSAYWQACVDSRGTIHLSWVWRESADVASNHDLCYARSLDGGMTWEKSTGEKYTLPINAANAEYCLRIPQNSELINQTSMFADDKGHPFIAGYWRHSNDSIIQYQVVYKSGEKWQVQTPGFRKTGFTLSGTGTKRIPVSRPQIVSWSDGKKLCAAIFFRDEERGARVSMAVNSDLRNTKWTVTDLTQQSVGSWEPTYDTELWKEKKTISLFVQHVEQADAEGNSNTPAQMVYVLTLQPQYFKRK